MFTHAIKKIWSLHFGIKIFLLCTITNVSLVFIAQRNYAEQEAKIIPLLTFLSGKTCVCREQEITEIPKLTLRQEPSI